MTTDLIMPPDYLFADTLLDALFAAGAFGMNGLTFEHGRDCWRAELDHRFLGYFPATREGYAAAVRAIVRAGGGTEALRAAMEAR